MKRALLSLVLALLLLPGAAAAQGKLRIATEGAYPPFNYVDANGELAGFDVDIARALCVEMSRECEIIPVPWVEILNGLGNNKYEMVVASMARNEERERVADFTDSYYRSRTAFAGRKEMLGLRLPEGFRGLVLTTQQGTSQAKYLQQHYSNTARILLTETMEKSFAALVDGRADIILSDSLHLYEFLTSDKGRPFDFIGDALPADDETATAHIAVRKGDDELRERINAALRTIRLRGEYDRINRKYFPFSIY